MTKQELTDELTGLQQKRLDLAPQLDQMTLRLQRWDEHISLLKQMLATLQTQGELEEKRILIIAGEALGVPTKPALAVIKSTSLWGGIT